MAAGKEIETRGHVTGFREEIARSAVASEDEFFTWFNHGKDKDAAFVRGSWDFMFHVARPASGHLSMPEDKVALEIGHGGGRLLAAASRYFREMIGVDIHDNNALVEQELNRRGAGNFRLIKTGGSEILVDNDSIDLVYSFIVFQHVERIEVFKNYIKEAYRILKPGGIAVIYFARKYRYSINKSSRMLYCIDKVSERFRLPKGYQEIPAKVNCTNLFVSLAHAKSLARQEGFEILADLVSRKAVPDGIHLYGGQNGLLLRKYR